eukprot:13916365-Heterocapsa_arctica.AAC.1
MFKSLWCARGVTVVMHWMAPEPPNIFMVLRSRPNTGHAAQSRGRSGRMQEARLGTKQLGLLLR